MPIKCPYCEQQVLFALDCIKCENGHCIETEHGVIILQEPSFSKWYVPFEKKFQSYRARENFRIKDESIYDQLPNVPNRLGKGLWNAKAKDLEIVRKFLSGRDALNILEIGAWNGWLSHHLNQMGHHVTAIDYFIDPYDGLGAKKYYSHQDWTAIQMNLERLDLIDEKYDLIIVNRMIVYFENPIKTLNSLLQEKLNNEGQILVTGVIATNDKPRHNDRFYQEMKDFEKKEGFSLCTKPFFGPFTDFDLRKCEALGFQRHYYKSNLLGKLKSFVRKPVNWQLYLTFNGKNKI